MGHSDLVLCPGSFSRLWRRAPLIAALAALALVAGAGRAAALTAHADYVVGEVPVAPTGDVAYAGASLFAGQGSFGAGTQSIVRVDADGSSTVVVTGLNAIGGLAYDAVNDRLLFTDNALEAPGAPVTGDTVYELGAPLAADAPVAAVTLELLPAGAIPFAQAVLPRADGSVLIGDAAGFGAGRVVELVAGTPSDLITGLDFTAGVALAQVGGELLVGEVDSSTFTGAILRYDTSGLPLGTLAGGLSGAYDQVVDTSGRLLVSGGFTGDFSSSTLVRITSAGAVTEVASGLVFSTGLDLDPPSGQIAVVDFAATGVATLTPVERMTPGGAGRRDCNAELWGGTPEVSGSGRIRPRWTCTDGDPACDRDGVADGSCLFLVGACFAVSDARLSTCTPESVDLVSVERRPKVGGQGAFPELQAAVDAVLPATGAVCSQGVAMTVEAGKSAKVKLRALAVPRTLDRDTLTLRCRS